MTNYLKCLILIPLLAACATQAKAAPEKFECDYEDVLAFELKEAAYDLPEGYTICLHIDQVRDTPTP